MFFPQDFQFGQIFLLSPLPELIAFNAACFLYAINRTRSRFTSYAETDPGRFLIGLFKNKLLSSGGSFGTPFPKGFPVSQSSDLPCLSVTVICQDGFGCATASIFCASSGRVPVLSSTFCEVGISPLSLLCLGLASFAQWPNPLPSSCPKSIVCNLEEFPDWWDSKSDRHLPPFYFILTPFINWVGGGSLSVKCARSSFSDGEFSKTRGALNACLGMSFPNMSILINESALGLASFPAFPKSYYSWPACDLSASPLFVKPISMRFQPTGGLIMCNSLLNLSPSNDHMHMLIRAPPLKTPSPSRVNSVRVAPRPPSLPPRTLIAHFPSSLVFPSGEFKRHNKAKKGPSSLRPRRRVLDSSSSQSGTSLSLLHFFAISQPP